jgi:hypothetical protein
MALSKLTEPANLTGIRAQLQSRGLIKSINKMAAREKRGGKVRI